MIVLIMHFLKKIQDFDYLTPIADFSPSHSHSILTHLYHFQIDKSQNDILNWETLSDRVIDYPEFKYTNTFDQCAPIGAKN